MHAGQSEEERRPGDWRGQYLFDSLSSVTSSRSLLTDDDPPLSKRGQRQANALGDRFHQVPIDHLFVSPADRAVETALRLSRLTIHHHRTMQASESGDETVRGANLPLKIEPGLYEVSAVFIHFPFR